MIQTQTLISNFSYVYFLVAFLSILITLHVILIVFVKGLGRGLNLGSFSGLPALWNCVCLCAIWGVYQGVVESFPVFFYEGGCSSHFDYIFTIFILYQLILSSGIQSPCIHKIFNSFINRSHYTSIDHIIQTSGYLPPNSTQNFLPVPPFIFNIMTTTLTLTDIFIKTSASSFCLYCTSSL